MHKNVSATLTANEAVALGVIEPLYCSLFCHVNTGSFQSIYAGEIRRYGRQITSLLGESCSRPIRSNAFMIVRSMRTIRKSIRRAARDGHDLLALMCRDI